MGRQHALVAVLAGVGIAALIPSAPWPVRGLAVLVCGGAGLLPDLDHPRATAARSLGLLTKLVAVAVDRIAVAVYHATRAEGDSATRTGGHRTLTHTVPWSLLTGVAAGVLCLAGPVSGAVACALLGGLLSLGLRVAGATLAAASGAVAWWVLTEHSGWWPVVPVAVTVGCLCHIAGDFVTTSGVPIMWPLLRNGKRWDMVSAPVTFSAGDSIESVIVGPALIAAVFLSVASLTGVTSAVFAAALP